MLQFASSIKLVWRNSKYVCMCIFVQSIRMRHSKHFAFYVHFTHLEWCKIQQKVSWVLDSWGKFFMWMPRLYYVVIKYFSIMVADKQLYFYFLSTRVVRMGSLECVFSNLWNCTADSLSYMLWPFCWKWNWLCMRWCLQWCSAMSITGSMSNPVQRWIFIL